jgi:hypothetical protein
MVAYTKLNFKTWRRTVTEDEAFETLDKQQQQNELLTVAQREAQEFIEDHADQLGIMTLRKAFEMGYRFGYSDALRRDKNAAHKS